ncbi:MAG: GAF domain-containing protein [Erysipelotrichaceae bacterium]|nr:GAF domain-containing protein [Erysipelotrichaceae bacterium]MBR2827277.1 GAF domain-containing protein [Erysipelotrichaceae bacterium]
MKQQDYEILIEQLKAMCEGQKYMCTLLSNTSALLKQSLQDTNWVGYYLMQDGKLILGPFQGLVACEVIEVGKGVCGTSVERRETILVRNVHEFAGHIACDSASNSEIVVPIIINDAVWGVLDIDSPLIARFDETDQKYLEIAAGVITAAIKDIQS